MPTPPDLDASPEDLASEVARLRARVAELEARLAAGDGAAGDGATGDGAGGAPRRGDAVQAAALFDRLPTALTLYDRDLRYLHVNAAFAALHGRRPEEFRGRSIHDMAPQVAARLEPYYRRVLATGEPITGVEIDGAFPHGSGRRRHLLVDFYPLPGADGGPDGVGAVATDVTDIKATETALREGEARFRSVVESDMIGIGFWESGGRITDANGALLELIGYTREEFAAGAIPWPALTPPEYFASDEKAFAQMQAAGHCTPYQKEYVRRDGVRVPVLFGGAAFDERRDRGAFFVIDLSERRRAELALRESEERLRTALSAAQTGTWRWDFVADIDTRDAGFNALLGLPPVETATPVADFLGRVVPEDRPLVEARRRAAAQGGEAYDVDLRVRRADGAVRWLRDVGRVIHDDEGRPRYMTGACVDITARREAEAERGRLLDAERAARAEAERAQQEAAFLAEAGRVLAASLDYETTLATFADLAVPRMAD